MYWELLTTYWAWQAFVDSLQSDESGSYLKVEPNYLLGKSTPCHPCRLGRAGRVLIVAVAVSTLDSLGSADAL